MTRVLAALAAGAALASPLVPAHANLCDRVTNCPGTKYVCDTFVSGCTPPYVGCWATPEVTVCV